MMEVRSATFICPKLKKSVMMELDVFCHDKLPRDLPKGIIYCDHASECGVVTWKGKAEVTNWQLCPISYPDLVLPANTELL